MGSAQTWHASSLLQHGSIIVKPQAEAWLALMKGEGESPEAVRTRRAARLTSVEEILGRTPKLDELKEAIRQGMAQALRVEFQPGELSAAEWTLARTWLFRRKISNMREQDITQISLGRYKVGITGLKEAIEEVKALQWRPEAEIAQALLERLRPRNYIPASAREEYKAAFLREYKRALGEKVVEERLGLSVKILGRGCPNCEALEQLVMAALAELNLPAEVDHVRDRQEIMALGVFGTPALMIKDEVKAVGQMPTQAMLKKWLVEKVAKPQSEQGENGNEAKNRRTYPGSIDFRPFAALG